MRSHPPLLASVWSLPGEATPAPTIYVDCSGRAMLAHPDELAALVGYIRERDTHPARAGAWAIPLSVGLSGAMALVAFLIQH